MTLKLGPVLKFFGCENDQWRLGVLAATVDTDLALELSIVGRVLAVKSERILTYTNSKRLF